MIDFLYIVVILGNIFITLFSLIEHFYNKHKKYKKYEILKKELSTNISDMDKKINSDKYDLIFKNYSYNIKTKDYDNILYIRQKNRFQLFLIMNSTCNLLTNIYDDKDIYCNIRIKKNDLFHTIAHYRSPYSSNINIRSYSTTKNTDLVNICNNFNYTNFVITNIKDYKEYNNFELQNHMLENLSKAIINIPLKNNSDLLGCFTIYFSKPLNEKVKMKDLNFIFINIEKKLSELIKEYIELNSDNYDLPNNILIENKLNV